MLPFLDDPVALGAMLGRAERRWSSTPGGHDPAHVDRPAALGRLPALERLPVGEHVLATA
jgi:hypothetical protein